MHSDARRAHAITALITLIGAACCILQAVAPFRGVFQGFTVQVTFVAGALTYARAVRWLLDPAQAPKARLILRGNIVVLASVAVTLILDVIAQYRRPRPQSVEITMAVLGVLAVAAQMALVILFRRIPTPAPPSGLTIADGIDDLLALIRWAVRMDSDRLFAWLRSLSPRQNPGGFAALLGLTAGLAAFSAHLLEGAPANFGLGLLVVSIFVGIEVLATLAGFVTLGPYLGLRDVSESSRK
jgi:hypothetical protein